MHWRNTMSPKREVVSDVPASWRKPPLPEGVVRDIELEQYLLDALHTIRERRVEESNWHDNTEDKRIHVSEYGEIIGPNACDRKLWYKRHGFKGVIDSESEMIFEIGHVIGLRFANILAATGDVESVELAGHFSPWPLKGRLDVLTNDKLKKLIDWKTATTKQINYLPKMENFGQANQYMWELRRKDPVRYADYKVEVVYVFKDPTRGQPPFMAFQMDYNETMALEFLNAASKAYQVAT